MDNTDRLIQTILAQSSYMCTYICPKFSLTSIHWLFHFSPSRWPITTGYHKVQANTMKAYRKQQQTIHHRCHLCHVTPSHAILVGVCLLILPMLELAAERAQLTTMYYTNHVHPCHMNFWHTHLLALLNNVLPAMVLGLQNRVWSNIKCPLYTTSHSSVYHVFLVPVSAVPTGLGRRVVGVAVLLLLLMSGDIEINPGPVGEGSFLIDIRW